MPTLSLLPPNFSVAVGSNILTWTFRIFHKTTTTLSRALCIPSIDPTTSLIHGASLISCITKLEAHMLHIILTRPYLITRHKWPPTPSRRISRICICTIRHPFHKPFGEFPRGAQLWRREEINGCGTMKVTKSCSKGRNVKEVLADED